MTFLGGVSIFSGQSDLPEVYVYFQIRVTCLGGVCIFIGQSDLPWRCMYIFRS